MDTKKIGVLAILAASVMWAIEPIFTKIAARSTDFLHIAAARSFVAALIALIYVLFSNRGNLAVPRHRVPQLLYIGVMGTIVADLLYVLSLTKIPVINAVLLGHMQPIFIVLIGFFFLREDKLTGFDYVGIVMMVVAGLLVTTKTQANLSALKLGSPGDLLVLVATFVWATTAVVMRKYLRDLNAGVLVFYRFLTGTVAFAAYILATSTLAVRSVHEILVGVAVGIGSVLYYEGLKRIKAAQVSALELSTPFFASALAFLLLAESFTPMQVVGLILLVPGIHFLSRKEEAYF
jgi:drug/metabolite transporter (DMT)-like permease